MVAAKASERVIADRIGWIDRMIQDIGELPFEDLDRFTSDKRNVATAESCLRRALEALLDLGRHILAKIFTEAVTEYKQIADKLESHDVLDRDAARILRKLAGYRNRLVHFYHEVTTKELYSICTQHLDDLTTVRNAFTKWGQDNPQNIDRTL